jgi:peptide/nickel transport system permease protein
MLRFALRRAGAALLTLLGVLSLVFLLMAAAPGDPAALAAHAAGHRAVLTPAALSAFRTAYGLDRPVPLRFGIWLVRAATFDFGRSFLDGREVSERILETLPATLVLNAGALFLAILVALPAGIAAARRPGGRFDRASGFVFDVVFAAPSFVLGMFLLLVFSVRLGWTPLFADRSAGIAGYALPVLTLALSSIAVLSRFVRACVREALEAPSAVAGRARGEGSAAQVRRALRASAVPFAAMGAAILPTAVSGSVLVERLFSVRGSGELLAEAVFARDYPTVLGLTVLVSVLVVVGSASSDVIAAVLDPRTRDASPDHASALMARG